MSKTSSSNFGSNFKIHLEKKPDARRSQAKLRHSRRGLMTQRTVMYDTPRKADLFTGGGRLLDKHRWTQNTAAFMRLKNTRCVHIVERCV